MAKKTTKKDSGLSTTQQVSIGVGLTAAAVAAAGAYFLYGSKDAAKNRKTVKSWMLKAKAEVLEKLENAKEMTQDEYMAMIGAVASTYGMVKGVTKTEVATFAKEMKAHWGEIEKKGKKAAAPKQKAAAKAKPAVKKSAAVKPAKKK